jgi:hypothetical protein
VLGCDATEVCIRCVRSHAPEKLIDLPRPLLEIGAEDRNFKTMAFERRTSPHRGVSLPWSRWRRRKISSSLPTLIVLPESEQPAWVPGEPTRLRDDLVDFD